MFTSFNFLLISWKNWKLPKSVKSSLWFFISGKDMKINVNICVRNMCVRENIVKECSLIPDWNSFPFPLVTVRGGSSVIETPRDRDPEWEPPRQRPPWTEIPLPIWTEIPLPIWTETPLDRDPPRMGTPRRRPPAQRPPLTETSSLDRDPLPGQRIP